MNSNQLKRAAAIRLLVERDQFRAIPVPVHHARGRGGSFETAAAGTSHSGITSAVALPSGPRPAISRKPVEASQPVLVHRGWELLETLAEELEIALIPAQADHVMLQGSLATFTPCTDIVGLAGYIYYNAGLDRTEYTFAVAHELGHYCLHRGQAICHRQDLYTSDMTTTPVSGQVEIYNAHNQRERDANLFALELLMPSTELRAEYLRRAGTGVDLLESLAAYFSVSVYHLTIQLMHTFLAEPLPPHAIIMAATGNPAPVITRRPPAPDQQQAIETPTPALVLAGPGAGKTSTLVERVRYLIQSGINPSRLLVLTFSNKAAGELRERLARADVPAEMMQISTFHAYGADFLRRYAAYAGLDREFRMLDEAHAFLLMEDLLDYLPAGYYISANDPIRYFDDLLGDFSRAKDYLHTPDDYDACVDEMERQSNAGSELYTPQAVQRARERAAIYRIYETHKHARDLVDFGDLMMLPVRLLRDHPDMLAEERSHYDQILVDEYQDINYASGELLRLLCAPAQGGRGNIWAVGDIHQSIYRFRGAFPRQAGPDKFTQAYRDAAHDPQVLELRANYRSVPAVVALANHLRGLMPTGATQPLVAVRPDNGPALFLTEFATTRDEANAIIASIRDNHTNGHAYAEHAILCQRHTQADNLAKAFDAASIPASRLGSFFNRPEIQELTAVVAASCGNPRLALFTLARGRFSARRLIELAREFKLPLHKAWNNATVLAHFDTREQEQIRHLATMLDDLRSRRTIARMLTVYLFNWSTRIIDFSEQEHDQVSRQSLRAIGRFLQLAYAFDEEQAAQLVRQEARRIERDLTPDEADAIRKQLDTARHRRRFMRYIQALQRTGTQIDIEPEPESETGQTPGDAVHILTAHASKGLEFPFVYLPGLYERKTQRDLMQPVPPGLHLNEGEGPEDDMRSLFYVACTRARDMLSISWARTENLGEEDEPTQSGEDVEPAKKSSRATRQPAKMLLPVQEFRDLQPERWGMLPQAETRSVPPEPQAAVTLPVAAPQTYAGRFGFWDLHTYATCPSRYYYQRVQKVGQHRNEGQSLLYQGLRQVAEHMHTALAAGRPLPPLDEVREVYRSVWPEAPSSDASAEETGPDDEMAGVPLGFYLRRGLLLVDSIWQHYKKAQPHERPLRVELNRQLTVPLQSCEVEINIDRIEHMPDGTIRLIRSTTGDIPTEKQLDNNTNLNRLLTLYVLSFEDCMERIEVIYEVSGQHGVAQIPMPKTIKKARDYRRWERGEIKSRSLLDSLNKIALQIHSRDFKPHPGEHCKSCSYYLLLCPKRLK